MIALINSALSSLKAFVGSGPGLGRLYFEYPYLRYRIAHELKPRPAMSPSQIEQHRLASVEPR